ncbi:hypothetical protein LOTGIDRAFT_238021 [Lottia gigantea]|uniref:SH3 domain-containing protein n=1 Tax=Lottia gigantea TaxID=225164 RepID=V4AE35_LOTGI|nr:hypothetical protein LOTGIDRAFT_238021 [Lottia gigantea]ESP02284.1 hypothetical protein LOTGIDRAFT_238021 [Lottia gigantea]
MEVPKTATRLHLTKDDKHLKNFAIWKTLFKQLADAHLHYGKSLTEVASHADTAFRNDPDIKCHGIMIDIGQVLINELKSQAQVVKAKWSDYNEENNPYLKLSQIDGKSNKAMLKAVHEACNERKAIEHRVKHAQKKFFRAFENTRALMEKMDMLENEPVDHKDILTELTNLKSKTDVYLAKYKSTYQSECDCRGDFIEKMTSIEDRWMLKERENLETWIDTCQDLCHRLDETSPRAFKTPLNDESPYPGVFKKLTHVRRMEDIRTPPSSQTRLTRHKPPKTNDDCFNTFIVNRTCSRTNSPITAIGDNPTPESSPGKHEPERRERRRSRANRVKHQPVTEDTLDNLEEKVCRAIYVKEQGHESDSDVEIIELEGAESYIRPKHIQDEVGHHDPHYIRSSSEEELDQITPRPIPKYNLLHNSDRSSQPSTDSSVASMENVYVAVIKEYIKTSKNEMDLKIGMHIKQKQSADEFGMAYGWYKRNKVGVKKYGYYPVDHVVLLQKSSWVKMKI